MSLTVDIKQTLGSFSLDISFDAPPGVTVLFGRSGSGKSTVVNAVAGLTRPESGIINLDGTPLFDGARNLFVPPNRRRLGYVFQDARLFPHMTVRKNLTYGRRFAPTGVKGPDFGSVVDLLGLNHLLDRRPAALSGGEKQRVAIGRALLSAPKMLLADEPLAALDDQRKAEILPYFERLRDEFGVPILYVSHSAAEVARLANTIVVLQDGRVVRAGDATEVMADPSVTPLGPAAAGAVLPATVVRHHPDGLSELSARGLPLYLPRVPCDPGETLRVHVEAQDVMLALKRPEGISALNVFSAVIRDIRLGDGPGALVQLDASGNLILSRVTRRSVEALSLAPGQEVFAILKAVSVAQNSVG